MALPVSQGLSGVEPWLIMPYGKPGTAVNGYTSDITGTTSTVVVAGIPNKIILITHLLIQNSHASTGTWLKIFDGVKQVGTAYAASGGAGASVPLVMPLKLSPGNGLYIQCETTAANVRAWATGCTWTE